MAPAHSNSKDFYVGEGVSREVLNVQVERDATRLDGLREMCIFVQRLTAEKLTDH